MRRVGHKGADLIAPGNTLPSFDAALAAGVDMIEFDVLPERETGRLVLAHDYKAAAKGTPPSLEEGLTHFKTDAYEDIELDVDLKLPGYEDRVVEALRSFGLLERSLVSSQYVESLDRIRALEPGAATRLVGPSTAARLHAQPGDGASGVRRVGRLPRPATGTRRSRHPRRAL